ncbi:hypothetical protein LTR67_006657 [Exophiala xenobiotica]
MALESALPQQSDHGPDTTSKRPSLALKGYQPSPSLSSTSASRAKNPWIILVNGLADPQTTWSAQVSAFTSAGYTVLTYDNRGIGLSSRPSSNVSGADERWTTEDMASDLRALVTTVVLDIPRQPYHILGISMGGMIAQTYALNYCGSMSPSEEQEKLLCLTLCCTYAAPGPFCSRMFNLWGDMARQMSVSDVMRDVLLWCFTPEWFADPAHQNELAEIEGEMAKTDEEMGLPAYLAQLNVITSFDSRKHVHKLGGRAFDVNVLVGERDVLIPNVLSRELADLVEGSNWIVTEGGHACNWEYPEEFNEKVLQGLKAAE